MKVETGDHRFLDGSAYWPQTPLRTDVYFGNGARAACEPVRNRSRMLGNTRPCRVSPAFSAVDSLISFRYSDATIVNDGSEEECRPPIQGRCVCRQTISRFKCSRYFLRESTCDDFVDLLLHAEFAEDVARLERKTSRSRQARFACRSGMVFSIDHYAADFLESCLGSPAHGVAWSPMTDGVSSLRRQNLGPRLCRYRNRYRERFQTHRR